LPKQYPSLKPKEVIQCLQALGFVYTKSQGDHDYYEKGNRIVQVDMGEKQGFATPGMQIIINNSGYPREVFYGATKKTAKKIGIHPLSKEELKNLD
jgi:predicted RNA binding protein YcfA (HicA-like mRNA interferase family)